MKIGLCVIDTNVPITANKSLSIGDEPEELTSCISNCIEAIESVKETKHIVLDFNDEIYDEYKKHLSFSGQPGPGDAFFKWLEKNRWSFSESQRVVITKTAESYVEFPDHHDLADFDISDRKFVAVANAHPEKPPILQAVDSKWWGWKDALEKAGIVVHFLCEKYIREKYKKKIESC